MLHAGVLWVIDRRCSAAIIVKDDRQDDDACWTPALSCRLAAGCEVRKRFAMHSIVGHRFSATQGSSATSASVALLLVLITACTVHAEEPAKSERPTAAFRQEHIKVQEHLRHVHEWVGALAAQDPARQKETAQRVATFFETHIKSHAEWEERFLYPIVDKLAGAGPNAFTSTMRHEHRIVGRWIAELRAESEKPTLDVAKFVRRADNLLGLIWAHFEEEEEVLLPFVDKGMSKAQFEKQLREAGSSH